MPDGEPFLFREKGVLSIANHTKVSVYFEFSIHDKAVISGFMPLQGAILLQMCALSLLQMITSTDVHIEG